MLLTNQTAYEQIRAYFTRPDAEFAVNEDMGACQYRTPDGQKCAVGCLIPDELYKPEFDADNLELGQVYNALSYDVFMYVTEGFLAACQSAHDDTAFKPDTTMDDFITRLDYLALGYGLTAVTT